jgi:ketosteroid isomerase-like protein
MSRQESKQVVKDLYAAFGRGDITSVLALIAEDVVWRLPGTVPDYSGTYEGQTSVVNFFEKLSSTVEIEGFEPRDYVAESDRVLVAGWSRGRVKSTGRMFDNRWVMAFSVRDGKIIKFEEYADTQALAAAHDVNSRGASALLSV